MGSCAAAAAAATASATTATRRARLSLLTAPPSQRGCLPPLTAATTHLAQMLGQGSATAWAVAAMGTAMDTVTALQCVRRGTPTTEAARAAAASTAAGSAACTAACTAATGMTMAAATMTTTTASTRTMTAAHRPRRCCARAAGTARRLHRPPQLCQRQAARLARPARARGKRGRATAAIHSPAPHQAASPWLLLPDRNQVAAAAATAAAAVCPQQEGPCGHIRTAVIPAPAAAAPARATAAPAAAAAPTRVGSTACHPPLWTARMAAVAFSREISSASAALVTAAAEVAAAAGLRVRARTATTAMDRMGPLAAGRLLQLE